MQGVILAAGKGTRLQPITLTRSKAMAPIAGKPIVERVLETLVHNGIHKYIMLVSQEDEEIRDYFTQQSKLDIEIQFVVQTERLGMANALRLAAPHIENSFILSACDNLTPPEHIADLLNTQRTTNAHATLSLMEVAPERISRTGIVDIQDGRIRRIVEKPTPEEAPSNVSSLPLYIFSRQVLDYLPEVQPSARGEYELQDAIQMLIERDGDHAGGITGIFAPSRLQLTNAGDLLALNRHYLTVTNGSGPTHAGVNGTGVNDTGENGAVYKNDVFNDNAQLIAPVRVDDGVTIGANSVIGPYVYLERGCRIGVGATIRNAVVLRDAVVDDGQRIEDKVIA